MVQQSAEFANDAKVQKLKFTSPWVKWWMRRSAMRRRRCTAQIKELPAPKVIQARMADIQKKIEDGNYQSSQKFVISKG